MYGKIQTLLEIILVKTIQGGVGRQRLHLLLSIKNFSLRLYLGGRQGTVHTQLVWLSRFGSARLPSNIFLGHEL